MSRRRHSDHPIPRTEVPTPRAITEPLHPFAPPAPQAGDNARPRDSYLSGQPSKGIFLPGDPTRPVAGLDDDGHPRQFAYEHGYNILPSPRHTEDITFEQLRHLSHYYEGVQICEKAIFRVARRMQMQITPRAENLDPGEDALAPHWAENGRAMAEWFEEPDHRGTAFHDWLIMALRDNVELDAVAIYHRRDRAGRLHGLELVAGDTISPLLDVGGRRPQGQAPAFAQYLYGVPASLWLASEIDYLVEHPRTDSPYGVSRVESIVLRINQALRKEHYDLARFTDGATPTGFLEAHDPKLTGMKAADVQEIETMWNALLAGNTQLRVRTKVVPPGWAFNSTQEQDIATDFDRWLLNITAAAFGLTMDELGFTETSNRSVGDSQERVVYRNSVLPLAQFFGAYLDRVIRRYDGTPITHQASAFSGQGQPTRRARVWDRRYHVTWVGVEEPEDFYQKVHAARELIDAGIMTPADAQRWLRLPHEVMAPKKEDSHADTH